MTRYIIAILLFVSLLAATLLYIGDNSYIVIQSDSGREILSFSEVQISWQAAIVLTVLFVIGLILLWSFLIWLWKLPALVKSGAGLRRRNHALHAMEEALLAGAEGDQATARKKAGKARALISSPALGRIVSAQAAEHSGDSAGAIENYQALLKDDRTRLAGQRGLAQQYLNSGDFAGAIEQAKSAFDSNKTAKWALDTLFQAQMQDYRWLDAAKTLEEAQARKQVEKDVARRRRAVLLTAEADRLENSGKQDDAALLARAAIDLAPDFVPAAALLARLYDKSGETKKAAQVIEKAWNRKPHPALALAYRDIYEDEAEALQRKKLKALSKTNPKDRESIILKAEEDLLAGNPVSALSDLGPLLEEDAPSARLCLLAAKIEEALNNKADAALWTARAATAPREADWSDLDPEGDAFDYSDQDWRRLVHTFGETGEMIHPRFETGAARRGVLSTKISGGPADSAKADTPKPNASGSNTDETHMAAANADLSKSSASSLETSKPAAKKPQSTKTDNAAPSGKPSLKSKLEGIIPRSKKD